MCILFAGTDGQDGPTNAAGVIITSKDIIDLSHNELEDAEKALKEANSYNFWKEFRGISDSWNTFSSANSISGGKCHFLPGLTGTNVMDITIVICDNIWVYIPYYIDCLLTGIS